MKKWIMKLGRPACFKCKKPISLEMLGGIVLVLRKGFYLARCVTCKSDFRIKKETLIKHMGAA